MVVQSAAEAVANAEATSTTDEKGACLWQTQEWLESPHQYPDATSQWEAAQYRHPGDTDPPAGFPVFWTGGSKGYGHAAVSVGDGKVRSTDQQSNYHCDTIPISEVHADWGLSYAGWSEDIASIRLPYAAGDPANPNDVQVGDLVLVVANGELNGRAAPASDAPVVTTRPYGDAFTVAALQDGWAQEAVQPAARASVDGSTMVPVLDTDYLHGVDISSYQAGWTPDPADEFVFIKATEGQTYTNPAYEDQLYEARAAGLVVGHYHWLNDGSTADQVDYFLAVADLQPGDLIAVDWEDESNPTTGQKDDWIRTVQERTDGRYRVGLYCNRDWWINHDTSSFYGDFLWIANYTTADDPGIEADWLFWQYDTDPLDQNRGRFADAAALRAWAGTGDAPPDPDPPENTGAWFSTDYLFPKLPDPTNPNGIKNGDRVTVTANGGLKARTLPGGPQATDKNGKPLVRAEGYEFDVTADLVDGWVTGGTNFYSSDYLEKVDDPPPPTKPGWNSTPAIVLPMSGVPGSVSYLQGIVKVGAVTCDDGTKYGDCYVLAQDYDDAGDIRFLLFDASGKYQNWFQVNDAGHGQSIYAYRSAAGNLYVWAGEDPAYRYAWQSGKKVSRSSGTKMDYKGARPQGGYNDRVAFRNASDTKETFSIFDRTDFTDGTNRTKPIKEVTVSKRTDMTQQSWWCNESRIYRIMGSTNESPDPSGGKHILDVFDWSGKLLLSKFDITGMHRSGATEDEPEGGTFSDIVHGTGVLAFKREGSASASKRSYVGWTMTGLP